VITLEKVNEQDTDGHDAAPRSDAVVADPQATENFATSSESNNAVTGLPIVINDAELAEHAKAIRMLCLRCIEDLVEIGRRLAAVKGRLGHGRWLAWLKYEFAWSAASAQRYMRMHELVKSRGVRNLAAFDITALQMLSRPSTPEAVRQTALAQVGSGQYLTVARVRRLLKENATSRAPKTTSPLLATAGPVGKHTPAVTDKAAGDGEPTLTHSLRREAQAVEELARITATVAQANKALLRRLTHEPFGSRISAYEAFRRDVLECISAKRDDETRAPSERHVECRGGSSTTARPDGRVQARAATSAAEETVAEEFGRRG
jgi:hypothetical protein